MQRSGTVTWKAPSNIALVKYWGKYGTQLPRNPSISFTLDNAHTITQVAYNYSDQKKDHVSTEFWFEDQKNNAFKRKIDKFLSKLAPNWPFLYHLDLKIKSQNSFPHSSGIASSASSMAALAMCLVDIEKEIEEKENIDYSKASHIARLGSGSASRSLFPKVAVWGASPLVAESSNLHAIPYHKTLNPIFHDFQDDILIVSDKEKSVSSRMGHALMENNPYADARFKQANNHLDVILQSMIDGDLDTFGMIVEREALTLHALMMASDPPFMLLEPETLKMIRNIQSFRADTMVPVYFTLDAGPNIHLLYPKAFSSLVEELKADLKPLCHNGMIIADHVGNGPKKLT